MSPFTLFLNTIAVGTGILVIGTAFLFVLAVFIFLIGGKPQR